MLSEDLSLSELVEFHDGGISLCGRRLILHDIRAFAQFRKDLLDSVGAEHAQRLLTRFGYFWGSADAAAMKRIYKWESTAEWLNAGARMNSLQGIGKSLLRISHNKSNNNSLALEWIWRNSVEAREHLSEFGVSNKPACWILVGYASGYSSYCLGEEIYFIENKCLACNDPQCVALGKKAADWGDELAPYLQYFKFDGISNKVGKLSCELRKKDIKQLQRHEDWRHLKYQETEKFCEIRSKSFLHSVEIAERVALFDTSVLITGESGTGKEVMARYIHARSLRKSQIFTAINCGALPETLLEGELFGYKKGSFTGAMTDRVGLLEEAGEGTILLDEIGDLSIATQVKLLRVVQEREIIRLGENRPRKIKARIIAATNRNLEKLVQAGAFREDLYYRLAVVLIEIPPLRERVEDIPPLVRHFVSIFADKLKIKNLHVNAECFKYFQDYNWPGNVRELENAIERAAVFAQNACIKPHCLPENIIKKVEKSKINSEINEFSLERIEKEHILTVLNKNNWNKSKTAEILKISQSTLWRKLKSINQ